MRTIHYHHTLHSSITSPVEEEERLSSHDDLMFIIIIHVLEMVQKPRDRFRGLTDFNCHYKNFNNYHQPDNNRLQTLTNILFIMSLHQDGKSAKYTAGTRSGLRKGN